MGIEPVLAETCKTFQINRREILGKSRHIYIMPARHALCKVLHHKGGSYLEIAQAINRHHSTIISSVRRATLLMQDADYAEKIDAIARVVWRPRPR